MAFYTNTFPTALTLIVLSAGASVPIAQSNPPPEAAAAPGGLPRSTDCSASRQDDAQCLPRGPGSSPATPGPILPPSTPPAIPQTRPPAHPQSPGLIVGQAAATLRIKDTDHDVVYESNIATLVFIQRAVQDMPGNTQYVLVPQEGATGVTWTVRGTVFECTVEGQAIVNFPLDRNPLDPEDLTIPGRDQPLDPMRPVFGYLNLVGPDGGDYHSIMVKAFNPDARLTKTCPGNPPVVTKEPFDAGYLLHILWEKNTYNRESRFLAIGNQTYDQGDLLDFTSLLPPGAMLPDFAIQALNQTSSPRTVRSYTWRWGLAGY